MCPMFETGGEGGIRTHVTRKESSGFQDRPVIAASVPLLPDQPNSLLKRPR